MSQSPQSKMVPPPPSNGGILRKDSSFSKAKMTAAKGQTPAGQNASKAPAATPSTNVTKKPAGAPAAGGQPAPPPGMWGPNGQFAPNGQAPAGQPSKAPAANTRAPAASPSTQKSAAPAAKGNNQQAPPAMNRQGSFTSQNPFGSQMGGMGSQMGGMGSQMGGMGGYGSQMGGMNSQMSGMNPYGSQMGGMGGMGSQMGGMGSQMGGFGSQMGMGSQMGGMNSQMGGMNPYGSQMGGMGGMGSMYGNQMGNGSMYGFSNNGSQMNMGSMYSQGGMGSLYGLGGMGSMYRPVGSMYGMGGAGQTSAYNFAAQWGSLANMSQQTGEMSEDGRRSSISGKGGFGKNSKITTEDLCPNIGTFEDGRPIKRSGKRGGNRLYSKDKNDTTAPVVTSSSQASAMTIKRKTSGSSFQSAATRSTGTTATTKDGKTRAKVPANFDVHTLLVVGQDKGSYVTVRDPNAVVFQSGGKKETFECDEALEQTSDSEDVDSVLLSGLRGNWFGGHNSSLLVAAGKGKTEASYNLARGFIDTCLQRLETNEKDASTVFDITITMCAIKNGDTGKDLLGSGDYKKLKLASSPIYGPCLNDLTTKTTKKSAETLKVFNGGLSAAKDKKDIICAFLVLKQIKKVGSGTEVHLSSLCVALFQEEVANLVSLKDKSSSSPHKLFRYALGGPSVCCSALCVSNSDEKARDGLEAERKVREVKNREPRSGNVKKFIGYTEKEIARQKEKLSSASDSEKKSIEKRVASMESMVKDAQEMQDNPEKTAPKGYAM